MWVVECSIPAFHWFPPTSHHRFVAVSLPIPAGVYMTIEGKVHADHWVFILSFPVPWPTVTGETHPRRGTNASCATQEFLRVRAFHITLKLLIPFYEAESVHRLGGLEACVALSRAAQRLRGWSSPRSMFPPAVLVLRHIRRP